MNRRSVLLPWFRKRLVGKLMATLGCWILIGRPTTGTAEPPQWWTSQAVIVPDSIPDDFAAANIGQLKNLAVAAASEIVSLWGESGPQINALVNSLQTSSGDNYAAVTVAELKAVATPFYQRLSETLFPEAPDYPWGDDPETDEFAVVNIGQLKNVFSFDLRSFDTDFDGLPDWWEIANGFDHLGSWDDYFDDDGDGISNYTEFLIGTDPHIADTDANGIADGDEDSDGDGWSNAQEEQTGVAANDSESAPDPRSFIEYETDWAGPSDEWTVSPPQGTSTDWSASHIWKFPNGTIVDGSLPSDQGSSNVTHFERPATPLQPSHSDWFLSNGDGWTPILVNGGNPIVPLNNWNGPAARSPWEYPVNEAAIPTFLRWETDPSPSEDFGWGAVWKRFRLSVEDELPVDFRESFVAVTYRWDPDGAVEVSPQIWEFPPPIPHEIHQMEVSLESGETEGGWHYLMPYSEDEALLSTSLIPISMGVYPIEDDDAEQEGATYRVSADQHEVTLSATVFTGTSDISSPDNPLVPVGDGSRVRWEFEGASPGGSFETNETETSNGFTSVKLTTSSNPGDTYKVTCKLVALSVPAKDGDPANPTVDLTDPIVGARSALIEVVPGLGASTGITHANSNLSMPADGTTEQEITVFVTDKFGNIVHPGTPVSWRLKGLGIIKSKEIETDANGMARATVVAGTVPGDQVVQVIADVGLHEITIENTALAPTVSSSVESLDASQAQVATVTAAFPGAADGAPVVWHATRGQVVNAQSVVSGGQAVASYLSEPGPNGTAFVGATVGSSTGWARIPLISEGTLRVTNVSQPVLAANSSTDGSVTIRTADGSPIVGSYAASTDISIHMPGKGGQTAHIAFGDSFVNQSATFTFNELTETGVFQDTSNLHYAIPVGATLDDEQPYNGGGAAKVNASSTLTLGMAPAFALRPGFLWESWVRPDQFGGDIIHQPGRYRVSVGEDGFVTWTVWTGEGQKAVTSAKPLELGTWHRLSARYLSEQGGITIQVDESMNHASTSGVPTAGAVPSLLGYGFAGTIDEMFLGVPGDSSNASAWLTTNLTGNEVLLDADGRATFTVTSTGQYDPDVNGEAANVPIQVQVGSDPPESLPGVISLAAAEDVVRLQVMLDAQQPGATFTQTERVEIVGDQIGKMAQTGQRSSAANLPASGSMAQQVEAGYQVGIFIGKGAGSLGDGAYVIRIEGTETLDSVLLERVAQFAEEASRQGSDVAAQRYAEENGGKLIREIANYLRDNLGHQSPMVDTIELGPIPADVRDQLFAVPEIIDSQEAFEDFNTVAENDRNLFEDLLECIKTGAKWEIEAIRYTASMLAAPLNDLVKWKNKVINGIEDFVKQAIQEGLGDGTISTEDAFNGGVAWGAVRQLTDMIDIISPEVAGQIISSLIGIVVGAVRGDKEAKLALADMAPIIGTWALHDEVEQLKSDEEWFSAGQKFTELAVSASEDSTLVWGAATLGTATAIATAIKILRKSLKRARHRGIPEVRNLPDFLPHESPAKPPHAHNPLGSGENKYLGRNFMPTKTIEGYQKWIISRFGGKVELVIGKEARERLDALDAPEAAGGFYRLNEDKAYILFPDDAPTRYVLEHEIKHADHWTEIGDAAFQSLHVWEREHEVFKRLLREVDLMAEELQDAIKYLKRVYKKNHQVVPGDVLNEERLWKKEYGSHNWKED